MVTFKCRPIPMVSSSTGRVPVVSRQSKSLSYVLWLLATGYRYWYLVPGSESLGCCVELRIEHLSDRDSV